MRDHSFASRIHIDALDGLRGVAVLGVLWYHAADLPLGWAGVDIFFVLSGFLITGILLDARQGPLRRRAAVFYGRRALRILPLAYGALALAFFVIPIISGPYARSTPAGVQWWYWAELMNWRRTSGYPAEAWLGHFWSLAVEEQFYLLWPWIVWSLSRRRLSQLAAALCVIALALRISLVLGGATPMPIYEWTFARMDALAAGALVACVVRDPASLARWAPRGKAMTAIGLAVVLAAIFIGHGTDFLVPSMQTAGYSAIALASAGVVLSLVAPAAGAAQGKGERARRPWLEARWLRWVGRVSYGIYVIHFPFARLIRRQTQLSPMEAGLLLTVFSCAMAALSWRLLEEPILRLKRRLPYDGAPDRERRRRGDLAQQSTAA